MTQGTPVTPLEHITFETLPSEIQRDIYSLLDVSLVCRAYVAFASRPSAGPAADYLETCSVVVSLDALDKSLIDINYSLLAQLPPCNVVARATIGNWRYCARQLNKVEVKLLEVEIVGEFSALGDCFRDLNHPITTLKLNSVSVDVIHLPKNLHLLSTTNCHITHKAALEDLLKLHDLYIDGDNHPNADIYTFDAIKLPPSIVKVTLPKHCPVQTNNLPHLTTANVDYSATLPWQQMEKVEECGIPNVDRLDNLKLISITRTGPRTSFQQIDCPKLETVDIAQGLRLYPRGTDISVLFTQAQMVHLTELNVADYHIPSFEPFKLLRSVRAIIKEPITEAFPVPATLEKLHAATTFSVEGIPPQLKAFYLEVNRKLVNVTIESPNVRDIYLSHPHDVTLVCPQLRLLELGSCHGKVTIDAPNLNKVAVNERSVDDFSKLTTLSAYKLVAGLTLRGLRFKQRLQLLTLEEVKLDSLRVEADLVSLNVCQIKRELAVYADVMTLSGFSPRTLPFFDVCCRALNTSCLAPQLIRGVEALTCYPSHWLVSELLPNAFVSCDTLQRLLLRGYFINCSKYEPLVIPAPVKYLTIVDCVADEAIWLKFEDESQLEHLEITYSLTVEGFDSVAPRISMETLGLTKLPPSFFCPLLKR